jgi:hypothetical protein
MRIVQIIDSLDAGGAERWLLIMQMLWLDKFPFQD